MSTAPLNTPRLDTPHLNTLAQDTSLVFTRELRPFFRDPFSVVFTLVQPIVFLVFFGPLLADVTGTSFADSLQWFVPGIIVMSACSARRQRVRTFSSRCKPAHTNGSSSRLCTGRRCCSVGRRRKSSPRWPNR